MHRRGAESAEEYKKGIVSEHSHALLCVLCVSVVNEQNGMNNGNDL
jgi:hypothetical protein